MIQHAVVVVDDNGEVVVMGAYRWQWVAEIVRRATENAIKHAGLSDDLLGVYVEDAGPRVLGRVIENSR